MTVRKLIENNLIQNLDETYIAIRYLDEQKKEQDGRSTTSRINGRQGGRPKKPKNLTGNLTKPNIDKNKIREEKKRIIRPTLEQVTQYCQERGKGVDPNKWMDHYTANGWKVGKNPMKDWKAAVRTWEKNSEPKQGQFDVW